MILFINSFTQKLFMVPPLCATCTAQCWEDGTTADEVCGLRVECEASFPHCLQCSAPWRLLDEAQAPPRTAESESAFERVLPHSWCAR